MAYTFLPPSM